MFLNFLFRFFTRTLRLELSGLSKIIKFFVSSWWNSFTSFSSLLKNYWHFNVLWELRILRRLDLLSKNVISFFDVFGQSFYFLIFVFEFGEVKEKGAWWQYCTHMLSVIGECSLWLHVAETFYNLSRFNWRIFLNTNANGYL